MIITIYVIILIYLVYTSYPFIKQHYDLKEKVNLGEYKKIEELEFNTGDIIAFTAIMPYEYLVKRKNPSLFLAGSTFLRSSLYYLENHHYFHMATIIAHNGEFYAYDLSLTSRIDAFKNKIIKGAPIIFKLADLYNYMGNITHYKYKGDKININLPALIKYVDSMDIKLVNYSSASDLLKVILNNGLKIGKYNATDSKMVCTDFTEILLLELDLVDELSKNATAGSILDKLPNHYYNTILRTKYFDDIYLS